jgi:hypothetical protein
MATNVGTDWEYLSRYLGQPVGVLRRMSGVALLRLVGEKIDGKLARGDTRAERVLHAGAPSGAAGSSRRTPHAQ